MSVSKGPGRRVAEARPSPALPPTGDRGANIVTAFFDSAGHVSVDRVAERFGMSKMQLAETIGLTRESVYRSA